jgi:UDP-N-acetylglucosamine 1-carboxyvinyltransferase
MSRYIILGGRTLDGTVNIRGAKNSVLPLLAASILTDEQVIIHNCPDITDVWNMIRMLQLMGVKVRKEADSIIIDPTEIGSHIISPDLAREVRSSLFLLGPIIGRLKQGKAAYPGGCDIGLRPIDIHLKGLRELNVKIEEKNGFIECDGREIKGADIMLDYPSVGATENIMMAAITAPGVTVIRNAAKEPEIVDLQDMLVRMGAKVAGAGHNVIHIEGVTKLKGTEYTPIPDRIVAGTYVIACALLGGKLEITGAEPEHISSLLVKLSKTSCKIEINDDRIYIANNKRLKSLGYVETLPYPGFPTDLQPQTMVLESVSNGTSVIVENIFETRFKHVSELVKMGAHITVKGRNAFIWGVDRLSGAEVRANDLRGGAALVLAGLKAEGVTVVNDIHHIDRGYENFDGILNGLGAEIKREI